MNTFIALLRGVNVGGHNKLPMAQLRASLEGLGLQKVATYIQSGNVVLQTRARDPAALSKKIRKAVHDDFGFSPEVQCLRLEDLELALEGNPFRPPRCSDQRVALSFLERTPRSPDLATLDRLKAPSEEFELHGNVFFLHAPEGFHRSKLAAKTEAALGVSATARNLRTVNKLCEMARA